MDVRISLCTPNSEVRVTSWKGWHKQEFLSHHRTWLSIQAIALVLRSSWPIRFIEASCNAKSLSCNNFNCRASTSMVSLNDMLNNGASRVNCLFHTFCPGLSEKQTEVHGNAFHHVETPQIVPPLFPSGHTSAEHGHSRFKNKVVAGCFPLFQNGIPASSKVKLLPPANIQEPKDCCVGVWKSQPCGMGSETTLSTMFPWIPEYCLLCSPAWQFSSQFHCVKPSYCPTRSQHWCQVAVRSMVVDGNNINNCIAIESRCGLWLSARLVTCGPGLVVSLKPQNKTSVRKRWEIERERERQRGTWLR